MTALTTNAAGLVIIKTSEGLYLNAIQDPTGLWTIGYGHTVGVTQGQQITQAQADALLSQDLAMFEGGVGAVAINPSSNEFSAMVSLAFNIGLGAFKNSTALRDHNAGDKSGAADAFLLWNKAHVDGQLVELAGLDVRRQKERMLYLTPDVLPIPAPPLPPPPIAGTVQITVTDQAGRTGSASIPLSMAASLALLGAGFAMGSGTSGPTATAMLSPSPVPIVCEAPLALVRPGVWDTDRNMITLRYETEPDGTTTVAWAIILDPKGIEHAEYPEHPSKGCVAGDNRHDSDGGYARGSAVRAGLYS